MGLIIVFIVLAVITVLFRFFGLRLYNSNLAAEERIKAERLAEQAAKREGQGNMEDEELVAVLTAAAAVIINKSVVIKNIRFLQSGTDSAWSRMGRLSVMSSHQVK